MAGPHPQAPDDAKLPALSIDKVDPQELTDIRPGTSGVAVGEDMKSAAAEIEHPP